MRLRMYVCMCKCVFFQLPNNGGPSSESRFPLLLFKRKREIERRLGLAQWRMDTIATHIHKTIYAFAKWGEKDSKCLQPLALTLYF